MLGDLGPFEEQGIPVGHALFDDVEQVLRLNPDIEVEPEQLLQDQVAAAPHLFGVSLPPAPRALAHIERITTRVSELVDVVDRIQAPLPAQELQALFSDNCTTVLDQPGLLISCDAGAVTARGCSSGKPCRRRTSRS